MIDPIHALGTIIFCGGMALLLLGQTFDLDQKVFDWLDKHTKRDKNET